MQVARVDQGEANSFCHRSLDDSLAQLVAKRVVDGRPEYSLSCNTDITVDLLKARRAGKAAFQVYGEVNSELPFMTGDAICPESEFSGVLDNPALDFPLFAPPAEPVTPTLATCGC